MWATSAVVAETATEKVQLSILVTFFFFFYIYTLADSLLFSLFAFKYIYILLLLLYSCKHLIKGKNKHVYERERILCGLGIIQDLCALQ